MRKLYQYAGFDIVCPVRDELFGCEYKEVEVCNISES